MQWPKGRPHPSGRPVRKTEVKGRPMWRIPDSESNVPRLRVKKNDLDCVGFIQFPVEHSDDEF